MILNGFNYHGSSSSYYAIYDTKWSEIIKSNDININISSLSTGIQYGQVAFEGLKAYKTKDNNIQLFRIKDYGQRFINSCKRLLIPEVPLELFIETVTKTVLDNKNLIPDYNTKGSLYIRPFVMGIGDTLGVKPSLNYLFMVVVTPVGNYFKDGFKTIKLMTSSYDRTAPNGLGKIKTGANYASSLLPKKIALENGFNDCLYLDPKTHTKIDETGATNVIGIDYNNNFITPQSNTILPSITNDSLKKIAKNIFKYKVIEKEILLEDLINFKEFGACGTAAVITPISLIKDNDRIYEFKEHHIIKKLYDELVNIQFGDNIDLFNWITKL